jgi:hypothetical protein
MKYERLTKKCEVGIGLTETSGNIVNDYDKVVQRLAELEDKIEREELVDVKENHLIAISRTSGKSSKQLETIEILTKYENGTLIELPCKVGDEIYIVSKLGIEEFTVKAISFTILDHDCWGTNYIQFVDKNGHRKFNYQVYFSEIGKTVFLTKAEAEKKLKEKELEK